MKWNEMQGAPIFIPPAPCPLMRLKGFPNPIIRSLIPSEMFMQFQNIGIPHEKYLMNFQ